MTSQLLKCSNSSQSYVVTAFVAPLIESRSILQKSQVFSFKCHHCTGTLASMSLWTHTYVCSHSHTHTHTHTTTLAQPVLCNLVVFSSIWAMIKSSCVFLCEHLVCVLFSFPLCFLTSSYVFVLWVFHSPPSLKWVMSFKAGDGVAGKRCLSFSGINKYEWSSCCCTWQITFFRCKFFIIYI